jgi:hypothetical protein
MYNNSKTSGSLCISKPCQDSKYDFKNFVNCFPDLKLPFQSNVLYSLSVGNSIEKNIVNYFIFFNQKNSQTAESPKIRKNNLLMEYSDNLGFVEDGEFYPVGRLYLNSNFISLIAKIFQGEYGYYELFNFNLQGKCLSSILLSKYSSGSSRKDSTAFIYHINFEIQRDGLIYLNEDYFSERDIYQTIRLAGDGYFEILHEYIRYPKEPLEIGNQNSPLYDPNSCAQTICDQLHPNYNPQACALSRIDLSSPNYDPSLFIALFYHLSLSFLR